MRFPLVLCNIIMGYQGPYQMVAFLAGVDFFVILLQTTEVAGKMPENGMEFLSDVEKKVKKIPCIFLKWYIFISIQHEGCFHARISQLLAIPEAAGSRCAVAAEAAPASPTFPCTGTGWILHGSQSIIPFQPHFECWAHQYLPAA